MSGRRVLVAGLPYFGTRVAESLTSAGYDARYLAHPGWSPAAWPRLAAEIVRADAIYAIGSSLRVNGPLDLAARARKPLLVHWVGTDVRFALRDWRKGRASTRVIRSGVHRADAPWLLEELAVTGIRGQERLLPVPVAFGELLPLPQEFRVLVYLREKPHRAYDVDATLEVIRTLPEINFHIVGGFAPPEPLANVTVLGFRDDMHAAFRESSALLRLMRHDGMSHTVIEAASFGRHVLWSYPLTGTTCVTGAAGAIAELRRLHALHLDHQLEPNAEGARHMQQTYDHEQTLARICEDLDRLLA